MAPAFTKRHRGLDATWVHRVFAAARRIAPRVPVIIFEQRRATGRYDKFMFLPQFHACFRSVSEALKFFRGSRLPSTLPASAFFNKHFPGAGYN